MSDEEDPYAVSSDSEDEQPRKKIDLGAKVDLSSLKKGLTEQKTTEVDAAKIEELQALAAKKEELARMKKEFEEGTVKNDEEETEEKKAVREEREKLTQIGKEKYSKFKDKFEHIDSTMGEALEERVKSLASERELELIEKGQAKSAKERFEKGDIDGLTVTKEKIEVARTEADKKRILSTFNRDMTADEAPKECAICSKTVYPVERVFANKRLYHKDCFKCSKCNKKLTATNYNSHEGSILCKVHFLALKNPDAAKLMDPDTTVEDEREEEDEDFAVSSKPKKLAADVVRSGGTTTDAELAALRGLSGKKKEEWETGAAEVDKIDKPSFDASEISSGKVKANKDKFLAGGDNDEEEEDDDAERDPNIIRENKKKKEELKFEQVGDIKNKWKTGEVTTAEQREAEGKAELEALKAGGVRVKERFQERKEEDMSDVKKWDRSELDTSAAAEARKSFLEGTAYDTASDGRNKGEVEELHFNKLKDFKERFEAAGNAETREELEKQAIDVAIDLGNIKAAFLNKDDDMSPEERAALKKKEIEAEFIRYKLARKAAVQRANEAGETPTLSTAGVGDVKAAFDSGDAFKGEGTEKGGLDVDIKIAGKAREKFQQISAGASPIAPTLNKKSEPSKWDKKDTSTAEIINRRVGDEKEDTPEDEDAYDVKNLMNKFKNIGDNDKKVESSEARAELEALKATAKSAKSRFEKGEEDDKEKDEEKKKAMQEEFDRLRREREEAKRQMEEELAEELNQKNTDKEDIAVAAEHAHKMTAKFEKLTAKEARKAEKSKMPDKKTGMKFAPIEQPRCPVCTDRVYTAEMIHCFGRPFHTKCFRCVTCKQPLRLVTARSDGSSLFCQLHSSNLQGLNRCHA